MAGILLAAGRADADRHHLLHAGDDVMSGAIVALCTVAGLFAVALAALWLPDDRGDVTFSSMGE